MLPLFLQELPTSCVPACVRMVLAGLGHSLSEGDIRHRCGHTAVGTTLDQIANGLRDTPVVVEYQIDWGLEDLTDVVRRGGWPIVAIDLRPVEGIFAFHSVVVVGRLTLRRSAVSIVLLFLLAASAAAQDLTPKFDEYLSALVKQGRFTGSALVAWRWQSDF